MQFLKTSNLAERGHWHWGHQPQQPASHNLAPQLSAIYFKNKFVLKLLQIIRLVEYPVELTLMKALGKGLSFKAFHLSPFLAYPCLTLA